MSEITRQIYSSYKDIGEIGSLWEKFQHKLHALKAVRVPLVAWLPIYCKAFGVDATKEDLTERQMETILLRARQIQSSSREYARELGENAYALFNVLTDFATYPAGIHNTATVIHSYQHKVGTWANDFLYQTGETDYSLDAYIGEKAKASAARITAIVA